MIRPLADIEREAIVAACLETRDCQRAARELGIGSTTLYRKLREYGEPLTRFRASKPVKPERITAPRCPACQAYIRFPLARQRMYGHLIRKHNWTMDDARNAANLVPVRKTDTRE